MTSVAGCLIGYLLIILPIFIFIVKDIKTLVDNYKESKNEKYTQNNVELKTTDDNMDNNAGNAGDASDVSYELNNKNENLESLDFASISRLFEYLTIFTFFGSILFCYILIRIIVELSPFRRVFKYVAGDFQDILNLLIRSFLIYVLGNISNRLKTNVMKIKFVICLLWFAIIYTITFESCPNITISADQTGVAWIGIVIVILIAPIFLYVISKNCLYAYYFKPLIIRNIYFLCLLFLLIFHILFILTTSLSIDAKYIGIHIHHHWWALLLSLVCRSDNKVTFIVQCCLIAIFIHGITVFGCEDLYGWNNDNLNQNKFINKCDEKWLCPHWKCELTSYSNN
eukprot:484474_1